MMETTTLPKFNGNHHLEWPTWYEAVLTLAQSANPPDQFGVIGFLLTQAEWELLPGNAAQLGPPVVPATVFVPYPPPGIEPATQVPHAIWTSATARYSTQQYRLMKVRTAMLASLDATALAVVQERDGTTRNLTLAVMMDRLRIAYGVARVQDMNAVRTTLQLPFQPPMALADHLLRQLQQHHFAHRAKMPISEADKVEYLRASLLPCGRYALALQMFVANHPSLLLQTFELLSTEITLAESNMPVETAASLGYAQATGRTSDSATIADYDRHMKMMTDFQKPAPKASPRSLYCWTHGMGHHSGVQCKNPKPGHKCDATKASER